MEYKVVTTLDKLIEIEQDYNSLLDRIENRQVFYEFAWLKNYILNYPDESLKDGNLCVVLGYQDKKFLVCCPFCMKKNILRFICTETNDYNTILVDSSENRFSVLKGVMKFISTHVLLKKIVLNTFYYSDVLLEVYIIMNYVIKCKSFLKIDSVAPFSLLQTESQKIIKGHISDNRRKLKKLSSEHKVFFEDTNILSEADLEFITQRKDEVFGVNIFTNKKSWKFFRELNNEMSEKFMVNRMFVDEKLVAIHFGFQDEKKVYYYIPCYDKAVSGVGQILLFHIIEKAKACGKECFDSLRGGELYKFNYCDRVASNFKLTVYSLTKKNRLCLFCYKVGRGMLEKLFLGESV